MFAGAVGKEVGIVGLEYVNRRGDRYFILQGKTKTGKPKFYCSKRPSGAGIGVERLPDGFEIYENPEDALVSVRKVRPTRIQPFEREELTRMARKLARTAVLVEVEGDSLVVYASDVDPQASGELVGLLLGISGKAPPGHIDWVTRHARYSPMLRFTLTDEDERSFTLERWCYLGSVDYWIPLSFSKPLEVLAKYSLPHIGQESFFELM